MTDPNWGENATFKAELNPGQGFQGSGWMFDSDVNSTPWIAVDLEVAYFVQRVVYMGRTDTAGNRLGGVKVYVGQTAGPENNTLCGTVQVRGTKTDNGVVIGVGCRSVHYYNVH